MNDQSNIEKILEEADRLDAQGSRSESLRLLRTASKLREDPLVLTRLGSLAMDLELWREAETALRTATKLDSDFSFGWFFLGLLYKREGRLEEALSCLQKAAELEPSPDNLTVLGVIQGDLGFTRLAKESLRKAVSMDPTHQEASYNLALAVRGDDVHEAIFLFNKALEIDCDYALAHRELGLSLRMIGQFLESEYHLHRAIELAPSDGWAYIYLGNLLWASERFSAAETTFKKAVDVWPDRSVSYWSLAHFLELQGRLGEAEALYLKGLEIDPSDAQANWRFGRYLKDTGEDEKAKFYLRRALELDPNEKRAAAALASLK